MYVNNPSVLPHGSGFLVRVSSFAYCREGRFDEYAPQRINPGLLNARSRLTTRWCPAADRQPGRAYDRQRAFNVKGGKGLFPDQNGTLCDTVSTDRWVAWVDRCAAHTACTVHAVVRYAEDPRPVWLHGRQHMLFTRKNGHHFASQYLAALEPQYHETLFYYRTARGHSSPHSALTAAARRARHRRSLRRRTLRRRHAQHLNPACGSPARVRRSAQLGRSVPRRDGDQPQELGKPGPTRIEHPTLYHCSSQLSARSCIKLLS